MPFTEARRFRKEARSARSGEGSLLLQPPRPPAHGRLAALYWSADALLHSSGRRRGDSVEHFFSIETHHVVPRLITAALFFALGFLLRAEYLRRRSAAELRERTRLAELGAAIGLILAEESTLDGMLQRCTEAIVKHLDALFARVWLYDAREGMLVLRASAGTYTHLDGRARPHPLGSGKIGVIARERSAHLTNEVAGDPLFDDQQWVRQEGIVAFAGHPLVIGDALLGVMAVFSRRELPPRRASGWRPSPGKSRSASGGTSRRRRSAAPRRSGRRPSTPCRTSIFTVDRDFRIVKANRALLERLGVGRRRSPGATAAS